MSFDFAADRQRLKSLTYSLLTAPHSDSTEALISLAERAHKEITRLHAVIEERDTVNAGLALRVADAEGRADAVGRLLDEANQRLRELEIQARRKARIRG